MWNSNSELSLRKFKDPIWQDDSEMMNEQMILIMPKNWDVLLLKRISGAGIVLMQPNISQIMFIPHLI